MLLALSWMSRRSKMDSYRWMEISTGCRLGAQLGVGLRPPSSSNWASPHGCLCIFTKKAGGLQENRAQCARTYQAFTCITLANAPLVKARPMAKSRISVWGDARHTLKASQNTEVGSLFLLQGIFPTQGLNPGLPHCRPIIYQLSHKGRPRCIWTLYHGLYHLTIAALQGKYY